MTGANRLVLTVSLLLLCSSLAAEPLWVFFANDPARTAGDPVSAEVLHELVNAGARIRVISRYFNAVSVEWEGSEDRLEMLPGVDNVRPVRSMTTIVPTP